MAEARLDSAVLEVDGRPLATTYYDRLQRLWVRESVQLPDDFELRFDDPHFELFDESVFKVGARLDISLKSTDEPVLVTSGEVTALAVEPGRAGHPELVVQGLDLTHRLAREPRSRTFQAMSAADIATRIAGEHGLDASTDGGTDVLPYVVQAGETDHALLARLAARAGLGCWVREDTLHLARRTRGEGAMPTLTWGGNLLRFSVRMSSSERTDEVEVHGWDPLGKRRIIGSTSEPERGTDAVVATEVAEDARRAFGSVVRRAHRIPVADQDQAQAVATALLQRASGSEVLLRGETLGNPDLGPGGQVRLEAVGERLAGDYTVTAVEHVYTAGRPYVTRFTCGGADPAELPDLLGAGSGAAGRPVRREHGLMAGIVTNNEDPERLGRVKVRLSALSEEDESTWARLATPGAGPDRGLQLLPDIDDEVVVGFEEGDLTRPFVLGGLWNRSDAPPAPGASSGGRVTERVLAVGDSTLVVTGDSIEVRGTQSLTLAAASIDIKADGELTLQGSTIRLN